jgi:hypothetical protein
VTSYFEADIFENGCLFFLFQLLEGGSLFKDTIFLNLTQQVNRSQIAAVVETVETERVEEDPSKICLQAIKLHFFYDFQPKL